MPFIHKLPVVGHWRLNTHCPPETGLAWQNPFKQTSPKPQSAFEEQARSQEPLRQRPVAPHSLLKRHTGSPPTAMHSPETQQRPAAQFELDVQGVTLVAVDPAPPVVFTPPVLVAIPPVAAAPPVPLSSILPPVLGLPALACVPPTAAALLPPSAEAPPIAAELPPVTGHPTVLVLPPVAVFPAVHLAPPMVNAPPMPPKPPAALGTQVWVASHVKPPAQSGAPEQTPE